MQISLPERRQIENELIFRKANEKVSTELKKLNKMYAKNGDGDLVKHDNVLHFICECSDENCMERVPMAISEYQKIHENRKSFIIIPGHEVRAIERVVEAKEDFAIVEKNETVIASTDTLHKTSVNNAKS